jgi:hypothetical protein
MPRHGMSAFEVEEHENERNMERKHTFGAS